jgi:hypothetical protein
MRWGREATVPIAAAGYQRETQQDTNAWNFVRNVNSRAWVWERAIACAGNLQTQGIGLIIWVCRQPRSYGGYVAGSPIREL